MVGSLGGSFDISTYSTTFFGLGNACTFPLSYFLGRRFGKLTVIKTALLLLCGFFVLTNFSSTFFLSSLCHFLTGISSGVLYPLAFDIIQARSSKEKKNLSFASIAALTSITPVLGASFGGWIGYDFHWTWIFYLQIPFILLTALILHKEPLPAEEKEKPSFDLIGYIAYLISIISWTVAICLGQELDWFRSPFLCYLFALAFFVTIFFVLWEWQQKEPFLDLHLFKIPAFCLSVFSVISLFSAYFGMIVLLSLWLHLDANYTPLWISLLLLHMVVACIALFVFMVKWVAKTHSLTPVLLAVACFTISCFYTTIFNADINFGRIAISRILAGFGLAFLLFPLLMFTLKSIPPEKSQEGIKIFQSARLLSGSLGVSVYTTIWDRRKVFYHDRLGSSLTAYSENTEIFLDQLAFFSGSKAKATELLESALHKQSSALAFADCFYLMAWIMLLLFIILAGYYLTIRYSSWKTKVERKV